MVQNYPKKVKKILKTHPKKVEKISKKGQDMDLATLYSRLHNLTQSRIVKSDIAKILDVDPAQLRRKEVAQTDLKQSELKIIAEAFDIPLSSLICQENINAITSNTIVGSDRIEIHYWSKLPEELKKPKVASVWFDREIIENDWGIKPESLCIMPMIGDSMTKYWYPIRNGDLLIIDTNITHIRGNGVYFGTSRENTRFWIREMQMDINMNVEFHSYSPSGEEKKIYTLNQLEEVDFKLIGKVVKNVSFRL